MQRSESLEEFYKRRYDWMPDNLRNDIGHFNVFNLEALPKGKTRKLPYRRRDYFKILLVLGDVHFHYADKTVSTNQQSLVFSNPQIPYKCEHLDRITGGFYCIFNHQFFKDFGKIEQYTVFKPNNDHVFKLSGEQVKTVSAIYKKMFAEFNSDYIHKYDVLRNHVFELLHFAMKTQPTIHSEKQESNAAQRISHLFLELLERQFPIDENHTKVQLRSASDFARQLNVHVNHLNRAVKATTQKTTSQIISERMLQESKILLRHSNWNVSEIAFALGFTEPTHFNNFFKKYLQLSPSKFRSL